MTTLTPTLITHGGIMIHGGGILIGGEDWDSVITTIPTPIIMAVTMAPGMDIMAATTGDIMGDTMVDIMVEEAMAVDIGDNLVGATGRSPLLKRAVTADNRNQQSG